MIKGDEIVYDVADAKMYFLRGLGLPIMGFSGLVFMNHANNNANQNINRLGSFGACP